MEINHDAFNIAQMGRGLVVGALGCFLLLFLIYSCRRRSSSTGSPVSHPLPPGTFGFLWLSETLKLLLALQAGDVSGFVRERTATFRSNTFKTSVFFRKAVVVQGLAANRFIAASENKQQLRDSWPASVIRVLGEHILPAKHGAAHRRLRHILAACLGPGTLRKLVGKADLMTHLHFETSWKAQSQSFLLSLIKQNTFRIACSLVAGTEDEALMAQIYEHFEVWSAGLVSLPLDLPGTAFRRAKSAKQSLLRQIGKLIDSKQQTIADSDADLLCMLMRAKDENGGFLNREELQDIILFLLFAGFDTTASTLSFVLKYLERNSACYHRLLQEHEAIASQKIPGERLTWRDIQNMKYTWAIIQETLRLKPVAIGGLKEAMHDLIFDGYKIPRGWKVVFFMSSTHHDQQFFPQPHKFDPSRFDKEKLQEGNGPPPYVFVPFGIGLHSCPGGDFTRMAISIYLHHLALSKFRWTSIEPNEKVQMYATLTLAKSYPAKIFVDD